MKQLDVLVIGAGISGLMAALSIRSQAPEWTVQILDKGRSPGGRLATRRIGEGVFDHGAQFMTARNEEFRELLQSWEERGWVRIWLHERHPRYTAVGGMNQLAKRIAAELPVAVNCEVSHIHDDGEGYIVEGIDTAKQQPFAWRANSLLLTCPLPQAMKLLDAGGYLLKPEQQAILSSVSYVPCLGLLLPVEATSPLPAGFLREPVPGQIAWIADNRHKGISRQAALTIHMDAAWSEQHYGDADEDILRLAAPALREAVGYDLPLVGAQVKRWRYAQARQLIGRSWLDVGATAGRHLMLAGDAFAGEHESADASRVEHAVLSGRRAGLQLAR